MSKLDEVQHRFEWDAANFAAIYNSDSFAFRLFNRVFRKAIFARYEIAMQETGARGASILDIGCGSGIYSVELARRGAKRVLGLDFSEPMLEIARASAAQSGLTAQTEFRRGEFLAHDFAGETFDVTIAMGVFDYLEEAQPFLAKMAKLTRGKALASFPKWSIVRGTARRLRYRVTRRGDVFYYTADDIARLATSAGFARHRLVRIASSGGGWVLIGENQREATIERPRS
ncbi:MAG: class I SAM-dependent methyltransferase [Deltaproteobacteria bacterium]|nr:class I SAM-dependent methyltransferase [Deltaproteobacteria bacterium]